MSQGMQTIFSSLPPLKCSYEPISSNSNEQYPYVAMENVIENSSNKPSRCNIFCCWGLCN